MINLQLYREGKLYSMYDLLLNYCLCIIHNHEHASLLLVVTESEGISSEQVRKGVNHCSEVGFDICGTSKELKISVTQGKPQMHLNHSLNLQSFFITY